MSCPLASVLVLIVCTVNTMPVFTDKQHELNIRKDRELEEIIKRLNKEQSQQEEVERKQAILVNNYIEENFPWIKKQKHMKNYFTTRDAANAKQREQQKTYKDVVAVFVSDSHHSSNALVKCMVAAAPDGTEPENYQMAPSMSYAKRIRWEANKLHHEDEQRNKFKLHHGEAVFGVCDDVTKPCSYFMMLQDPLKRSIESYYSCQRELPTDRYSDMCQVLSAKDVSLRDWIIHHSNYLLHKFIFNSELCRENGAPNTFYVNNTCRLQHKLYFNNLTDRDKTKIVQYIINNMEKWFTVVGLYEDLESSMSLFEHVYNMPFQECSHTVSLNEGDSTINYANKLKKSEPRTMEYGEMDDLDLLIYDYEVQHALQLDILLYKRARDIFKIQKQQIVNKIGR